MSLAAIAGRRRRVLIAGMFDMLNFGDLLFPLIAEFRLRELGIDVIPVAPTSTGTNLTDAMAALDLSAMFDNAEPIDGILVGGGYIIHSHSMVMLDHYRRAGLAEWAAPGLWLGATLAAAVHDVPLAWNAPGVPHPLSSDRYSIISMAARACDYLSVRDRSSNQLLGAATGGSVEIVPDTIVDIARMWPRKSLSRAFKTLLDRKRANTDSHFVAFHIRNRSIADLGVENLAHLVDDFANAFGVIPILIAVGQSHDDDVVARQLSGHLRTRHVLLDDPLSLAEISAAIAWSKLYVGASLHGYIAAAAHDVPGIMVAKPAYGKFAGIVEHFDRPNDLANDWRRALDMARGRINGNTCQLIPAHVFDRLDTHWQRIGAALGNQSARRRERRDFLQFYFQTGVEQEGGVWAQRPFLGRRRSASLGNLRRV